MKKIALVICVLHSICIGIDNDSHKGALTAADVNEPKEYKSPIDMGLQEIVEDNDVPQVVRERARNTLDKWRNTEKPILLRVVLYSNYVDSDYGKPPFVGLEPFVFDKQDDLCGLRIREERIHADGTQSVREEDYPVYVDHYVAMSLPQPYYIGRVSIRDKGQVKDIYAWERYLVDIINWLRRRRVQPRKAGTQDCPEMPAVWISAPESDKVRVYVSVYDSEGHASRYVEVENKIGSNEGWPIVNMDLRNLLLGIPPL